MDSYDSHFAAFKAHTLGFNNSSFNPELRGIYADWTAAGQLYGPIEERLTRIGTLIGNTHTSDSNAGSFASEAFRLSHEMVARAVNAGPEDIVLFRGNGMTGAINWLQNSLGLTGPNSLPLAQSPIVIVTGLEHHSNHISWRENGATVFKIEMNADGLPDLNHLHELCHRWHGTFRPLIGSFSAASNVTGVRTQIHEMAEIVHRFGGRVIADFAASAPYDRINMHPNPHDPSYDLDAVVFSPHKFLGGPGSPGAIVFNEKFYIPESKPVVVGGGIVSWVAPDGECSIVSDISHRENAGSPSVLGAARAALAIDLKQEMDPDKIRIREEHLLHLAMKELRQVPGLHILEEQNLNRVGIISFVVDSQDYALIVRLLSDKFGVQARGGCSCAGPYGHYLLGISDTQSNAIREQISSGDASMKPGWVRLSIHPTMTEDDVRMVTSAVSQTVRNYSTFKDGYNFDRTEHSWHPIRPSFDMARFAREVMQKPLS